MEIPVELKIPIAIAGFFVGYKFTKTLKGALIAGTITYLTAAYLDRELKNIPEDTETILAEYEILKDNKNENKRNKRRHKRRNIKR